MQYAQKINTRLVRFDVTKLDNIGSKIYNIRAFSN